MNLPNNQRVFGGPYVVLEHTRDATGHYQRAVWKTSGGKVLCVGRWMRSHERALRSLAEELLASCPDFLDALVVDDPVGESVAHAMFSAGARQLPPHDRHGRG